MIYCTNPNDISSEHIVQSWGNGIKLVDPAYCHPKQIEGCSVSEVLKKQFNIYFMDLESQLKDINEQTVMNCGYESVSDALGRTARDVAKRDSAEQLIQNDRNVIKFNNPEITDDTFEGFGGQYFTSLSMKFPWYNDVDKIIGVFGCSVILDRHSLAKSLAQIAQFGLLFRQLPGLEIGNIYLSKREKECLQHYVRGKSAREISEILNLSRRTVEHYLESAKTKFSVSTKSELIDKVINYY